MDKATKPNCPLLLCRKEPNGVQGNTLMRAYASILPSQRPAARSIGCPIGTDALREARDETPGCCSLRARFF
jgi:hypothetical protein